MNILVRKKLITFSQVSCVQCRNKHYSGNSEFAEERYDKYFKSKIIKDSKRWADKVNKLPSIEQKLVELNMPKLFNYDSTYFKDADIPFNGLKFMKFVTRTHVEQSLPTGFYSENDIVDEICNSLEDEVKEIILLNWSGNKYLEEQLFNNISMLLVKKLQKDFPHLQDSSFDYDANIDAFWFFGHDNIDELLTAFLKRHKKSKDGLHHDNPMQAHVQPKLILRTKMPINSVVENDDELSCDQNIEFCKFMADEYGFQQENKRAVIMPGYFPGVLNEHGHLFFHTMQSIRQFQDKFGDAYVGLAHQQRAILAGFAQTFSHAFYEGASPFRNPRRPIAQQTVFSDGKYWVFSIYQLNTCNFSLEKGIKNNRNNILWISDPLQMFDTIEDGKVMGYNPDVLRTLIKMHIKETTDVLTPNQSRYVMNNEAPAHFKDEFHKHFRYILSGTQLQRKEPETAMWEKIYKMWHETRPQDAKRKPFELPWRRTPNHLARIGDMPPKYIPRALREERLITRAPRINSQHLLKYDEFVLRRLDGREKRGPKKYSIGRLPLGPVDDPYILRDH